jgi:hypothetical protein
MRFGKTVKCEQLFPQLLPSSSPLWTQAFCTWRQTPGRLCSLAPKSSYTRWCGGLFSPPPRHVELPSIAGFDACGRNSAAPRSQARLSQLQALKPLCPSTITNCGRLSPRLTSRSTKPPQHSLDSLCKSSKSKTSFSQPSLALPTPPTLAASLPSWLPQSQTNHIEIKTDDPLRLQRSTAPSRNRLSRRPTMGEIGLLESATKSGFGPRTSSD